MNIELNVDAEEIQKHLVGLILNSTVGESIKKGIAKQVEALTTNTYNNPIEATIKDVIIDIVHEEVLKHKEVIKIHVVNWLTDENIKRTLNKFDDSLKRNF